MEQRRLPGLATNYGTEKYYRWSQYDENSNLDVHHEHFKSIKGPSGDEDIKISSLGYGTYMGDPDDYTDFAMYDAIKQSVLSGGLNHIDTAPNYRYMKSERVVGKILNTLHCKYEVTRDQLHIATKAGYVPEDAETLTS